MIPKEIIEKRKERAKTLNLIICPKCGYCNRKLNVEKYGTCINCRFVLDKKAKFLYEIKKRQM